MLKQKSEVEWFSVLCLTGVLILCLPVSASANSSWVWFTETKPYMLLPYVVVGTLAIETLAVCLIPKTQKPVRAFGFVCLGNLISFGLPFFALLCDPVYDLWGDVNAHFYLVNAGFLVITLAVESPIVYYGLAKHTEQKKRLLWAVIGANVVTTALAAIVERTLCAGAWY